MGVGPDERLSGQSPEQAVGGYWLPVREILSGQHVMVPFDELSASPMALCSACGCGRSFPRPAFTGFRAAQ